MTTLTFSLLGSYVSSILLSIVAVACLSYFFTPPTFSFRIETQDDLIALLVFLATSICVTGLATKVRRLPEKELLQTRLELARFGRVAILGELTTSIVHELNQPLAGLVSSADACRRWLANDPPNVERANRSLHRIIRDADRAKMVMERVRNLSKNTSLQATAINVREALLEVILLTSNEIARNQISLETQFADELPLALGDRIQVQQVCLNLIVNAIESFKDLRTGPRKLLVKAEEDASEGVLVTVGDTGAGFDSSIAEDIFRAFYTTKLDGIGMGLAISRSIIEAHGGRLWASSNVPRGATFQFTLPVNR